MNQRGVCVPNAGDTLPRVPLADDDIRKLGAWMYDWTHAPRMVDGIEPIPMIYSASTIGRELGGNSEWVLGFNEPDRPALDMTPEQGAIAWRELEQAYPDRKLVSPATVTNWLWLQSMIVRYREFYYTEPRLDAVAIHVYPCGELFLSRLKTQVSFYSMLYRKSLWITEMACEDLGEMQQAVLWLEQDDRVERFAWFMAKAGRAEYPSHMSLFEVDSHALTAWGKQWVMKPAQYFPIVSGHGH